MDKTAIKNFSVWARNALIRSVTDRCGLIGVRADGIQNPLPQSTKDIQFFDAGTGAPSSISGDEIAKRDSLVRAIREKERDTDYKTAFNYIIEQVAYTWFNRLIAIRFMEVNDYLPSRIRVLSSEQEGKLEPDIIATPFDAEFDFTAQERDTILQLKDRGQKEDMDTLFRMLFVKQCDALHEYLPGLFQKVDSRDYTELLLNITFTDREGVVYHLVNDIVESNFDVTKEGQIEIIGWMYQYYNIEPKDETFALLKKNVKITKERIPAATQLFTPDWIVRYMVENSLGRLWIDGHPHGGLKDNWKYYLEEAEQDEKIRSKLDQIRADYSKLSPEDIRVIDPCMGSGHILVYCFDVLVQIYESQGYTQRDAAQLILANNLYGLDIDERAAQMSYFAIMMKARQYDRRVLTRGITPHVFAIQESNNIHRNHLKFFGASMPQIEANKAKLELNALIDTFEDAKEYGSILKVDQHNWDCLRSFIDDLDIGDQVSMETMGIEESQILLKRLIDIAAVMAQKYHAVVTNPPYMGAGGMNARLSAFVKDHYPDTKTDMSTVCMERTIEMCAEYGFMSMINIPVWMFLSTYEKMRNTLIARNTIVNMLHFGRGIFGSDFGTTAFVFRKGRTNNYVGSYRRLFDKQGAVDSVETKEKWFFEKKGEYYSTQDRFTNVPGNPIAYWMSSAVEDAFTNGKALSDVAEIKQGLKTGDNDKFLRLWFEVSAAKFSVFGGGKWYPCNKGGDYRRWYGNNDYVLNWENDGFELKNFRHPDGRQKSRPQNLQYQFKEGLTYTNISSSKFGIRYCPSGFAFDAAGSMIFTRNERLKYLLGLLSSNTVLSFTSILSPTMSFEVGQISNIPYIERQDEEICALVDECIRIAKEDWDSFETSWDFAEHPLVAKSKSLWDATSVSAAMRYYYGECPKTSCNLETCYLLWQGECNDRIGRLKSNEERLNEVYISIYGLTNQLSSQVDESELTIRRADLSRDIRSLLSYAVGCMFGRYSLDKKTLAFAGGKWNNESYSSFSPDADNCIPIADDEYLEDDVVERLCHWLRAVFGDGQLEANLNYIANALGTKGTTSREIIRNYFLNDFFKDHCTTYSVTGSGKRPIYWLYDSGKQNGFKALIYMHRYDEDTTGRIRADYLFKMQRAYENELKRVQDTIDGSSNSREIAQAEKRKEKLTKQLKETRDYDQKLAHLALARIPIDLDDGVKVNYEKVQTTPDGKKLDILAKI